MDQRREYIKIHATSYITKILTNHCWYTPTEKEKGTRPIEPMHPNSYKELEEMTGLEETKEKLALERKMEFSHRQCIGELIYAYVTFRLDIGYAISTLTKYYDATATCYYNAVKRVYSYLRMTI